MRINWQNSCSENAIQQIVYVSTCEAMNCVAFFFSVCCSFNLLRSHTISTRTQAKFLCATFLVHMLPCQQFAGRYIPVKSFPRILCRITATMYRFFIRMHDKMMKKYSAHETIITVAVVHFIMYLLKFLTMTTPLRSRHKLRRNEIDSITSNRFKNDTESIEREWISWGNSQFVKFTIPQCIWSRINLKMPTFLPN